MTSSWITSPISDGMTNVYLDGDSCPGTVLSRTATSRQAIATLFYDSDPYTCASPFAMSLSSFRILVPAKGSGLVRMLGRGISCSPLFGIQVLAVTGCEEGTCLHHHCYAFLDHNIANGYVMCRYRCLNNTPKLDYVLLDISKVVSNPTGDICEVYAWYSLAITNCKYHMAYKVSGGINHPKREDGVNIIHGASFTSMVKL